MHDEPAVFQPSDLTYASYLKLPELLSLQVPRSEPPNQDELLFIVVHQAYELWFKMILASLETARAAMAERQVLRAHHYLRRAVEILKFLVMQIHMLETMMPVEFLAFRDHLNPASGFQSLQFRELEFMVGLVDESYFDHFVDQASLEGLRRRAAEPSLWMAFQDLLRALGYDAPAPALPVAADPGPERSRLVAALAKIYADPWGQMDVYMLAEELVSLDAQLALWRVHHLGLVERVIGAKPGTGGSGGASYLRTTLERRCFPLLFEVRVALGAPVAGGCPFR